MTVLSANKSRPVKVPPGGLKFRKLPLAGYTNFSGGNAENIVYKGSIVVCDVTDTDGYYHAPVAIGTTAATGTDVIGGIAMEKVSVLAANTADGSKDVTVAVNGVWGFAIGSLDITDIGAPVYAQDDDSVTDSDTDAWWIGFVTEVDDTYIWVNIAPACGHINAVPAA